MLELVGQNVSNDRSLMYRQINNPLWLERQNENHIDIWLLCLTCLTKQNMCSLYKYWVFFFFFELVLRAGTHLTCQVTCKPSMSYANDDENNVDLVNVSICCFYCGTINQCQREKDEVKEPD